MVINENKKVDVLLTEYEVCINDVSQIDSDIWQSSPVFLGISVVGFTVLLQATSHDWLEFIVFVITALVGVSLIVLWNKLCVGWFGLINLNFHRMREIEKELSMWKERYIQYIDNPTIVDREFTKEEKKRLAKLQEFFPEGQRLKSALGVRKTLKYLSHMIIGGWVFLLVKQAFILSS